MQRLAVYGLIGLDPSAAAAAQARPAADAVDGDAAAGIADVIVLWNVMQHFWPYWDVVSVDWNAALDVALGRALADRTVDEHAATLRHLMAQAPDAHAWTTCVGETAIALPPFKVASIEGQLV